MKSDKQFSDSWKQHASGESRYLHWTREEPANQVQLAFRSHWLLFQELLEKHPTRGKKCIELGAGRGTMSMYFADAGWDCTLLDTSDDVLGIAKEAFEAHGLGGEMIVGDATATGLPGGQYDVCVSIGLLEHIEDLAGALTEQVRLLSEDGLLLAYVVPENDCRVQRGWDWLNKMLRSYHEVSQTIPASSKPKPEVYRDSAGIAQYEKILATLPVREVGASGVYPLPMLSPSISFPFTLNPPEVERHLVEHFREILDARRAETGQNPWLCEEDYGQSFLVWARKNKV